MVVAADLADWWDEKQKKREKDLEEWVQENPQWWAVGLATVGATSMQFTAGFVDVLRLGQGAAEGGWGFGKDALRLLSILGPLGRAGGMLSRFLHLHSLRLAVAIKGVTGPCTFTAANNAMSIVAGRAANLFLTVRDAAKAVGKPFSDLAKVNGKYKVGAWIDDIAWFLEANGGKIKSVTGFSKIQDVIAAASRENGVVIFAFRCVTDKGKAIHHTAIAVRDALGRVRFADYGGKFVNNLDDLVRNLKYGAPKPGSITLSSAKGGSSFAVLEGMEFTGLMEKAGKVMMGTVLILDGLTAIETDEDGVDLAIPISMVAVPVNTDAAVPPEVIKSSFDAFEARKSGKPVLRMPEVHIQGAPKSEYLTGVQFRLNATGFGAGPVDGILGSRTTRAIRAFQETYKQQFSLRVDSIPGPETQRALVSLCGY